MPKTCSRSVGEFYQHYPRTAAIVTCVSNGKENAMAVTWHSSLSSDPPLFAISVSPKRLTHGIILESKEFTVNFLPADKSRAIAAVGGSKGKDVDKFQKFGLATEKPLKVAAPILADAYASYECKLVDHRTYGDHDLFVGEIVAVHTLREAFSENGVLDLRKIHPALYMGADRYVTVSGDTLQHLDRKAQ